jgi:hypothetical protein
MKTKLSIAVLVLITLLSFKSMSDFKPYAFVLGHWQLEKNNVRMEEHWEVKDNKYTGWSKTWKGNDVVSSEEISIIEEEGATYYVANVDGHNDNKPVKFKLVESMNDRLVFENKEHDFPQRIIYTKVNRNEMLAQIEGEKGGKIKTIDFAYTRVKD